MGADHNDVLKRSYIERLDVLDEVSASAEQVDAKAIIEAGDGEDLVRSVLVARAAFAAEHARTYDRVTAKQVKAEGAALKTADPATIKSLRQRDVDEERARAKAT